MNVRISIVIALLLLVIISALGVVYTRHESRRLGVTLGELENRRDEVIAEWSRLQLEQAWLADAGQVESKAREQLRMETAPNPHILVIRP